VVLAVVAGGGVGARAAAPGTVRAAGAAAVTPWLPPGGPECPCCRCCVGCCRRCVGCCLRCVGGCRCFRLLRLLLGQGALMPLSEC
jgi:hypothetical protein